MTIPYRSVLDDDERGADIFSHLGLEPRPRSGRSATEKLAA